MDPRVPLLAADEHALGPQKHCLPVSVASQFLASSADSPHDVYPIAASSGTRSPFWHTMTTRAWRNCQPPLFSWRAPAMGINDRDYQRGYYDRSPGFHFGAPRMMTTNLIIFTCLVFLAQLLTGGSGGWVTETFSLNADWFLKPWHAYQLLTYGFLHDPNDLKHIAFNMLGLFFLGRDVEYRYGRREYLAFYLVAIVVAGLVWSLAELPQHRAATSLGASGGVVAVVILFALNFPHRTVLFMFFLPMPMWVAALICVGIDAMGAVHRSGNVAFTAHLGGAMFAFLYYQWGWRLERFLPSAALWKRLRPKPKLRVVDSDSADPSTDDHVDEILKKIQEQGRDSLTRGERRILEDASRQYQKRRH